MPRHSDPGDQNVLEALVNVIVIINQINDHGSDGGHAEHGRGLCQAEDGDAHKSHLRLVDRPTQLICISDIYLFLYVNRQIQKT